MRKHLSVRTTPLAWCSFLACLAGAALAGCGGSKTTVTQTVAAPRHTAPRRTVVSASVISKAATLSAAQPGYVVNLTVSIDSNLLGGVASASATGKFTADAGSLSTDIDLPGLLTLISPLTTPVIVADGSAYIEVPPIAKQEMPSLQPWLSVSLTGAGQLLGLPAGALAGALTPRTVLDALAVGSTGKAVLIGTRTVSGQATTEYEEAVPRFGARHSIDVWIYARTGMLARVVFNSASDSDAAQINFTAYGAQTVVDPPPAAEVGSLSAALTAAGI